MEAGHFANLPSSDVTGNVEFSDFNCGITGDVQASTVPALTAAMATKQDELRRINPQ